MKKNIAIFLNYYLIEVLIIISSKVIGKSKQIFDICDRYTVQIYCVLRCRIWNYFIMKTKLKWKKQTITLQIAITDKNKICILYLIIAYVSLYLMLFHI